jgi:hypothetical protein
VGSNTRQQVSVFVLAAVIGALVCAVALADATAIRVGDSWVVVRIGDPDVLGAGGSLQSSSCGVIAGGSAAVPGRYASNRLMLDFCAQALVRLNDGRVLFYW